ncbi:MAG: hypothetical protein J3R72DRAFT_448604 [Linnemannia gamsii]|nr:MAG: hypothetical protein J3R72DRAFT_448604 [Linnemannia gamsii]
MSQSPSMTAFLAVGAYELSTKSPTQGHTIVFDTASSGAAYPATGTGDTHEAVSLSAPITLDMQGIILSPKAIPLTMGSVSYILDEAADTSIVAYAITPSTSNKLSVISIAGKAPSFLSVQSATCLNNKIVIYSVSNSSSPTPSLNVFDVVGRTWSGPGLFGSGASRHAQSSDPTTPAPSGSNSDGGGKFPVAPVVGGISTLIVVALIAFYVHRRRRHRQFKRDNNPPSLPLPPPLAMDDDEDEISEQKLEMDSRLQKHSILTIQEEATRRKPTYPASHYPTAHNGSLHAQTHSAPPPPIRLSSSSSSPMRDIWSQPQPPFNPQFIESVPSNPQHR